MLTGTWEAWAHFATSGGGGGAGVGRELFFGRWMRGAGAKEKISRFQTSRGWHLCNCVKIVSDPLPEKYMHRTGCSCKH